MALRPGFYVIERAHLGKAIQRPRETMSIVAFLRAVRRKELLPKEVCVIGLERLLYRLADPQAAAIVVQQVLYNPPGGHHLRRQGPVVVMPLEYLELLGYWKAGIRRHNQPVEVFNVAWVLPKADANTIDGADVCVSLL